MTVDYLHYDMFDNDPDIDKIIRKPGFPDRTRAQFIADFLFERIKKHPVPRILEVGCHRGAFLKAFHSKSSRAELHGFDVNPDYARWIEPMLGPNRYHHGNLEDVTGPFDACVLIHTLEHVPMPVQTLRTLKGLLNNDGIVIIVVPDIRANPADGYTADHACHFDADTLRQTLECAGFSAHVDDKMIANELVVVGSVAEKQAEALMEIAREATADLTDISVLKRFESGVARLPATSGYVFGTATIGALLAACLGERCLGFADESSFRIGKTFNGKLVHHPRGLAGETVFLGVAENLALQLTPRLQRLRLDIVNPWILGSV